MKKGGSFELFSALPPRSLRLRGENLQTPMKPRRRRERGGSAETSKFEALMKGSLESVYYH
jgi:hypothetical protein